MPKDQGYLKGLVDANTDRLVRNNKKLAKTNKTIAELEKSIKERKGGGLAVALMNEHLKVQKDNRTTIEQDIKDTTRWKATHTADLRKAQKGNK